ncbi:hypothetical protein SpCBS45565_g08398 [Spizellomyces sp. 'palustris']|nr:hypothetical protein SpCBS45565_g08398 [Spizellomyces sp. 'palustris']
MADHFRFYPNAEDTITPWNARYQYPSQSNAARKVTPRIPPVNGMVFGANYGKYIKVQFPAQGYVNPTNTTLTFDVTLTGFSNPSADEQVRFQNNIQSIFKRVKWMYGSTPGEDIDDYNVMVRNLTEWTASNAYGTMDSTSINEGIGGVVVGRTLTAGTPPVQSGAALVNARQAYIQGIDNTDDALGFGGVPNRYNHSLLTATYGTNACTRRYQVSLMLGLLTQEKLIPTKFMASQLSIEIELASPEECIFLPYAGTTTGLAPPTYLVHNVQLIPEIINFDPSYDEMFIRGLSQGGV